MELRPGVGLVAIRQMWETSTFVTDRRRPPASGPVVGRMRKVVSVVRGLPPFSTSYCWTGYLSTISLFGTATHGNSLPPSCPVASGLVPSPNHPAMPRRDDEPCALQNYSRRNSLYRRTFNCNYSCWAGTLGASVLFHTCGLRSFQSQPITEATAFRLSVWVE